MEKIKLNYSILVSINKETILEICNAETNIVSFLLMSENFWRLPTSRINKKRTGSFSVIQKRTCSFFFKTLDTHRDFLVYRLW